MAAFAGIDQAAPLGSEAVGEQADERNVEEVRIREIRAAVGEREARGLEEQM